MHMINQCFKEYKNSDIKIQLATMLKIKSVVFQVFNEKGVTRLEKSDR